MSVRPSLSLLIRRKGSDQQKNMSKPKLTSGGAHENGTIHVAELQRIFIT
jgi:hypothetical protein